LVPELSETSTFLHQKLVQKTMARVAIQRFQNKKSTKKRPFSLRNAFCKKIAMMFDSNKHIAICCLFLLFCREEGPFLKKMVGDG